MKKMLIYLIFIKMGNQINNNKMMMKDQIITKEIDLKFQKSNRRVLKQKNINFILHILMIVKKEGIKINNRKIKIIIIMI